MTAVPQKWIDGTFIRTARKPHRCEGCRVEIVPGEQYAEYVGEVSAYQSGSRYCIGCAERQLSTTEWSLWVNRR